MKHSKLIIALAVLFAGISSCRKNDVMVPAPVQNNTSSTALKLAKIETADGAYTETFTYNADGRLTNWTSNYFKINYSYTGTPFGYDVYPKNAAQKEYDITDVVMTNGRAERFLYRRIKADGTVMWADTMTQKYDASGYQIQKNYGAYEYTAEISGGNITKMTVMNVQTGKLNYEVKAEYFTDKPNKTNINIFEYGQFDHILSDREQFGKKNTSLPKKIVSSGTSQYVYEYSYNLDAGGYITSYTISYTVNGGTPKLTTYEFTYL